MEQQISYQALPREIQHEIFTTTLAMSKNFNETIDVFKNISALHGTHYDHSTIIDLLAKQLPNDLNKAINGVKSLQKTTLKDFTALMDALAKKFPTSSKEYIAEQFNRRHVCLANHLLETTLDSGNSKYLLKISREAIAIKLETQIAREYLSLGNTFLKTIDREDNPENALNHAINLLDKGADPNFSWIGPDARCSNPDRFIIQTLIDAVYDKIFAQRVVYGNMFYYDKGDPSMMPIVALVLNRGAKPNAKLMKYATELAQQNPTELNIKLLELLTQAAQSK